MLLASLTLGYLSFKLGCFFYMFRFCIISCDMVFWSFSKEMIEGNGGFSFQYVNFVWKIEIQKTHFGFIHFIHEDVYYESYWQLGAR